MGFLSKLFGTTSEKEIKKIQPTVNKILALEETYANLTDDELRAKTNEFKEKIANGTSLDDILVDAFATVREASWRVLGMKPFPVQLMGGILLHQGRIAEMRTGEGKSLTATLPVYLNALEGKGAHVVTVNDYLAKRDSIMMGKVYGFLGLSTGLIVHGLDDTQRKAAYACDITYGTNNEFGFDYLRDNLVTEVSQMVQRDFHYAIVDEVDSILIDEARTPLIISGMGNKSSDGYTIADTFVKKLKYKKVVELDNGNKLEQAMAQLEGQDYQEKYSNYDYIVEEKRKTVMLTERGVEKAEKFYGIENLSDSDNVEINYYITRAMKAYGLFNKDVDYVVKDGKILIVDESTGRIMDGRRYNDGIHSAIEAKENVEIQKESKTIASITYQNLFRKYKKLSGMTGTAKTEEEEFKGIYKLDVVEVPTNKPIQRIDKQDVVFLNRDSKLRAIVQTVKDCKAKGQPILIGTTSVEKSEELSKILNREGIKHNVLNAKYHEQEAKIIAQAGKLGAITIATNMAGRGTDIILGGNPEFLALEELKKEGYSEELINEATSHTVTDDVDIINIRKLYKEKEDRIKAELAPEVEQVKAAGGLFILGSERHESRRIDNQLRGRSGRQGDVGVSLFTLSLEDDLMRIFGGDMVKKVSDMIKTPGDVPIDMKILSNSIEKAQKRIEGQYYNMRKNVLEYDEVIAKQRDIVYDERYKVVSGKANPKDMVLKMMKDIIDIKVKEVIPESKVISESDYENIIEAFKGIEGVIRRVEYTPNMKVSDFVSSFQEMTEKNFDQLSGTTTKDFVEDYSKRLILFLLDTNWQEHMITLDELKQGVNLQAYGQVEPLQAFKTESFTAFNAMMNRIREEILVTFTNLHLQICGGLGLRKEMIVTNSEEV